MFSPRRYYSKKNEHGILCFNFTTSGHFMSKIGVDDQGEPIYQTFAPCWVPECCMTCKYLDCDYGEFDEQLSPPYCQLNVWFPTKKGSCQKRVP